MEGVTTDPSSLVAFGPALYLPGLAGPPARNSMPAYWQKSPGESPSRPKADQSMAGFSQDTLVRELLNSVRSEDSINTTPSGRMAAQPSLSDPNLLLPHPGFSDEVNRNIAQSEIEGGVSLDQLSEGALLKVERQHHWYTIINRSDGEALISGHPKLLP
jgi:hypothetical protein